MQHFIAQYGVLAVFLLMLAESACIPIPSELIMLFGARWPRVPSQGRTRRC